MYEENHETNSLRLKYLGINAYKEPIIYMREDCHVCRAEGFETHARIQVALNGQIIIATINTVENHFLAHGEASLSKFIWQRLGAKEGDIINLSHPPPLSSLSFVRSKIFGHNLDANEVESIIADIAAGRYSNTQIATFLAATAGGHLNQTEIYLLTKAMLQAGAQLKWPTDIIVDKHCVGGLPGNRTTLIVVPIVTAFGLTMPKTSSRAITSPAGTADTMEVLAPVNLDLTAMQKVVNKEGGCIVWGGSVALSPADDIMIQIERGIDLDSEGQLVASVLSKKMAAGSTHIVIDMPIGPTAKIRTKKAAWLLKTIFDVVSKSFGIHMEVIFTDGSQPVGRGIGPALEAQDVLAVLQNDKYAPQDLRDRALTLAGHILEFSPNVNKGEGKKIAQSILDNGKALEKFQAICKAQGGLREIPKAGFFHEIVAPYSGKISQIDNRYIARLAKLAGAPMAKAAGVLLHTHLSNSVEKNEPLYTIFAETKGELNYALSLLKQKPDIVQVRPKE